MEFPDLAGMHGIVHGAVTGIEATHETEHDRRRGAAIFSRSVDPSE